MIAYYNDACWHFVTQRSHGLLAAQLCARWKLADQPGRWVDTLIATAEHDDVYNEFQRNPLIDANGAPKNFKDMVFEQDASEQLMDMALTKSRFIALLLSRHIHFTHGKEPAAGPFLKALKGKEKKWTKEAGTSKAEVDSAYALLEFCDAFSLLICQEILPPQGRAAEISNGPNGTVHTVRCCGALVVEPWPFETERFEVSYEKRTVAKLSFASDAELRTALADAPVQTVVLSVERAKGN
ncbi:DUF3891 family protein [Pedobacter namyangjuensis]|uniref:DUF3891 family protein n=1 Tax=Pedobacter namyangjuensis TaxID=600626 RepID=UPI000DE4E751|nr:DUF3891 family protein [Pedobacter namyangjuensis]